MTLSSLHFSIYTNILFKYDCISSHLSRNNFFFLDDTAITTVSVNPALIAETAANMVGMITGAANGINTLAVILVDRVNMTPTIFSVESNLVLWVLTFYSASNLF